MGKVLQLLNTLQVETGKVKVGLKESHKNSVKAQRLKKFLREIIKGILLHSTLLAIKVLTRPDF